MKNKNIMHMVIDLETTGLPDEQAKGSGGRYFPYTETVKYRNARIVSIAWIILDAELNETRREYHVIKPVGYTIPEEATRIHGISQEEAIETGLELDDVMRDLYDSICNCKFFVAHNVQFDRNILLSELSRQPSTHALMHKLRFMKTWCTMYKGRDFMKIKKMPRLAELHAHCHPAEPLMKNAHNALADTEHCAMCYRAMLASAVASLVV